MHGHLRDFFRGRFLAAPPPPTLLGPSPLALDEQCRIRDRSGIIARHLWPDAAVADRMTLGFLHSLAIEPAALPAEAVLTAQFDALWREVQVRSGADILGFFFLFFLLVFY